jgi:hypothetical protein
MRETLVGPMQAAGASQFGSRPYFLIRASSALNYMGDNDIVSLWYNIMIIVLSVQILEGTQAG